MTRMKESSYSKIKRLLNLILHFESKLQSLHLKPDILFSTFCKQIKSDENYYFFPLPYKPIFKLCL